MGPGEALIAVMVALALLLIIAIICFVYLFFTTKE